MNSKKLTFTLITSDDRGFRDVRQMKASLNLDAVVEAAKQFEGDPVAFFTTMLVDTLKEEIQENLPGVVKKYFEDQLGQQIKGSLIRAGVPNRNGHVYSEKAVESIEKRARLMVAKGELPLHAEGSAEGLRGAVGVVTDVERKEGEIIVLGEVLKTRVGEDFKQMLKAGVVRLAPRGTGTLEGKTIKTFELESVDVILEKDSSEN